MHWYPHWYALGPACMRPVPAISGEGTTAQQSGVEVAGILKRLEAWAADSPARHQLLVLIVVLGLGAFVLLFIGLIAWFLLTPGDITEHIE